MVSQLVPLENPQAVYQCFVFATMPLPEAVASLHQSREIKGPVEPVLIIITQPLDIMGECKENGVDKEDLAGSKRLLFGCTGAVCSSCA